MDLQHWGLREPPLPGGLNPSAFYPNPTHDEALARMNFLVGRRRGVGLLLGGAGSGKSLVLEVLAAQVRLRGGVAVRVSLDALEPEELLAALAVGCGLDPDRDATLPQLWRQFVDRLAEHRYQKLRTVLLLDDADRSLAAVRDQIGRLAQLEDGRATRLTWILAARPEHASRLGARLMELTDLRIDLAPWELADTDGYLRHALARAGRTEETFIPAALGRLHAVTQGSPRAINQVAELALLAAAAQGLPRVDEHTIDAVVEELRVGPTAAAY